MYEHSYIVSKKGCKKILKHLFPIKAPIDHILGNLSYSGKLNSYASTEQIFQQKREKTGKFKSNLDDSIISLVNPVCNPFWKEFTYLKYEFLR